MVPEVANGVVLITTKKEKRMPGSAVSLNKHLDAEVYDSNRIIKMSTGGGYVEGICFPKWKSVQMVNDGGIPSYGPKAKITGLLVKANLTSPSVRCNWKSRTKGRR